MPTLSDLVRIHKLNSIKLSLFPPEDGYELALEVNGQQESMFFTYQNCSVLELIDQGVLPTLLLTGICQSSTRYLYNDFVLVEVLDRRDRSRSAPPYQHFLLRLTESGLYKLTAVDAHRGDLEEERSILTSRADKLSLDPTDIEGPLDDPYAFLRSDWFSGLLESQRIARYRRRRKKEELFGQASNISLTSLWKESKKRKLVDPWSRCADFKPPLSVEDPNVRIRLKPPIKRRPPTTEFHEECVDEIRIESSSGAVWQLEVWRRHPDGQHFGQLRVLNWDGGDSATVRFPTGREESTARLVRQFVDTQSGRASRVYIRSRERAAAAAGQTGVASGATTLVPPAVSSSVPVTSPSLPQELFSPPILISARSGRGPIAQPHPRPKSYQQRRPIQPAQPLTRPQSQTTQTAGQMPRNPAPRFS